MQIHAGGLDHPAVLALLREHLADMVLHSPPDSVHALDLEGLRQPGVEFWSAWDGERLLGCGALKELDAGHGELKSMRTASAHRGAGVGAAMLRFLMDEAARRGYTRLSLETGSAPAFAPAHRLYARHGFRDCPPFGDYVEDPYSVFMTRALP